MAETNKTAVEFLEQFEPDLFWQQHGRKIVWGVIAVLAIAVIYVQMQRQAAEHESAAAARLSQAMDPGVLAQLAHEFQGKSLGAQALLRLAQLSSQAGRLPEAEAAYQEFLSAYPQHTLADAAQLGLATTMEAAGKLESAKARYLQLASKIGSYTTVAAKLGEARCAGALGQVKESRQLYEELAPAVAGTPWAPTIAIQLAIFGRTPEAMATGASQVPADMLKTGK